MASLQNIVSWLDTYLDIKNVKDDSWNGLQVAGTKNVKEIIFAVDAGMQTFEKAVEEQADMVVVHHGMFWKPACPNVVGFTKDRIAFLLKHNISLYASHLPLDKHPKVGNNTQLIKLLGFEKNEKFGFYHGESISFTGKTSTPKTLKQLTNILETETGATCKTLPFGPKEIRTMAVCSGGGAVFPMLTEAIDTGADLYLTGDTTEFYHTAKDIGINVIFAGHHATETVGVKALSTVVAKEFDVETKFIDIPTGL